MKARFLLATSIALILLSLPALVLAQPPVVPSTGPSGDGVGVAPLGSPDVLWDQPYGGGNSLASQNLSDIGGGFYSADDFSNAQCWNIESIFIPGTAHNQSGLLNADSLNWVIYADAGGQPAGYPGYGGELWSHSCSPFAAEVTITGAQNSDATLDILVAQGAPLHLEPGTYWLCFFPDLDYFPYGQYFWATAGTTNLAVARIIDPYDLFYHGWTSWTPWTASDPSYYDLAFRLEGTRVPCWWDFGDAPEGALAYPATGVSGAFPTCMNVTIAGWVQHDNFGTWFGPGFDFESDGNHGLCPGFAPYDNDECFGDGDAGLILPEPYTIQGGVVVPCGNSMGTPLGSPCESAQWGSDIDILIHNWMPGHPTYLPGYVNVLIDWNQDGQWQNKPATTCDGTMVPEHVLVDFLIPPQYDGTLSALGPPPFQIGPNDGYVWVRFSITERPVGGNWTGEGEFEDGETEDYLLRVYQPPPPPPVGGEAYPVSKASLLAPWIALAVVLASGITWYVLRRHKAQS